MAGTQLTQTTAEVAKHTTMNETLLPWFDKININTFFWQILILIIILIFRSDIKNIISAILAVIPKIKKVAGIELEFSEETKEEIARSSEVLTEEIKPYMEVIEKDPNLIFVNHCIEFEGSLRALYSLAYNDESSNKPPTIKARLAKLIEDNHVENKAMSIYLDIFRIRNKIIHGEKIFSDDGGAEQPIQAVFLLKNILATALKDFKNEN